MFKCICIDAVIQKCNLQVYDLMRDWRDRQQVHPYLLKYSQVDRKQHQDASHKDRPKSLKTVSHKTKFIYDQPRQPQYANCILPIEVDFAQIWAETPVERTPLISSHIYQVKSALLSELSLIAAIACKSGKPAGAPLINLSRSWNEVANAHSEKAYIGITNRLYRICQDTFEPLIFAFAIYVHREPHSALSLCVGRPRCSESFSLRPATQCLGHSSRMRS